MGLMSPLLWQSVPFKDQDSWQDFLGTHYNHHQAIAQRLRNFTGVPVGNNIQALTLFDDLGVVNPNFPSDPKAKKFQLTNLEAHANLHYAIASFLNVPRADDLITYDLNDETAFVGWMQLHALDHNRFRVLTGY